MISRVQHSLHATKQHPARRHDASLSRSFLSSSSPSARPWLEPGRRICFRGGDQSGSAADDHCENCLTPPRFLRLATIPNARPLNRLPKRSRGTCLRDLEKMASSSRELRHRGTRTGRRACDFERSAETNPGAVDYVPFQQGPPSTSGTLPP